jgi:hypothetical protein
VKHFSVLFRLRTVLLQSNLWKTYICAQKVTTASHSGNKFLRKNDTFSDFLCLMSLPRHSQAKPVVWKKCVWQHVENHWWKPLVLKGPVLKMPTSLLHRTCQTLLFLGRHTALSLWQKNVFKDAGFSVMYICCCFVETMMRYWTHSQCGPYIIAIQVIRNNKNAEISSFWYMTKYICCNQLF